MIVIHIDSQTDTSFLKECYKNIKDAIVLYNPTKEEVNETLTAYPDDDVMMMGHGSSSGLFSVDWKGNVIDYTNVHLLKGRNCIGIWCWAKEFARNYGLKGYFTSMFISNEGEARSFGFLADNKQVYDEVVFFAKAVGNLIEDKTPYEEWVGRLQSIADMDKPFVKYNYTNMEYFDGTQKPKFTGYTTEIGRDIVENVAFPADSEVDMWFEDYCYENGIEGDWAREIAYPIFVAGWNSHRYAEEM